MSRRSFGGSALLGVLGFTTGPALARHDPNLQGPRARPGGVRTATDDQRDSSGVGSASGLTDAERRAIARLYQAFNAGDPDLLDGALAKDWQDSPAAPGQGPGRDGLKPAIGAMRTAFAALAFEPQEVVGSGGHAAVRLILRGRHVGDWRGVPATGRAFEIAMHEMHHLANGLITHTWHVEDWAGWRRQVGAVESGATNRRGSSKIEMGPREDAGHERPGPYVGSR